MFETIRPFLQAENDCALAAALPGQLGKTLWIQAVVYKIRHMSGFSFVLLQFPDALVQAIAAPAFSCFPMEQLREFQCVRAEVFVAPETRSRLGYELQLHRIQLLSSPFQEPSLPVNNKSVKASLDTQLNERALVLRNEAQRAIFRLQTALQQGMEEYLQNQGFTQIHTPKLVPGGAEGGANMFSLSYFGQQAYLAQSPQLYKQILVGVFQRVYEVGPVFRAEKHDTSRHLNEYCSFDVEMGFVQDETTLMALETAMLGHAFEYVGRRHADALALLGARLPKVEEIPALRFAEAKALLQRECGFCSADDLDFEPEEERLLCQLVQEKTGSELVFVTGYRREKRPFYAMDDEKHPGETRSFDLLFRGLEITTGGLRIHEYPAQVEKMRSMGLNPADFEGYLLAHKAGLPPHGGMGIGLERLTARLLELPNLRQACLFPRDCKRLRP